MSDTDATPVEDLAPDANRFWVFVPELGIYISKVDGSPLDPRYVRDDEGDPRASQPIRFQDALTFTTAFEPSYDRNGRPLNLETAFRQMWEISHPDFELIEV